MVFPGVFFFNSANLFFISLTWLKHNWSFSGVWKLFFILNEGKWSFFIFNDEHDAQFFFYMFVSILYMFRAFKCSSSGDLIVSIRYLVYVTYIEWHIPDIILIQWISWWWVLEFSKHVENWNKYIQKKNCASSWSLNRIIPRNTVNRTQKKMKVSDITLLIIWRTEITRTEKGKERFTWLPKS